MEVLLSWWFNFSRFFFRWVFLKNKPRRFGKLEEEVENSAEESMIQLKNQQRKVKNPLAD